MITFSILARILAAVAATSLLRGSLEGRSCVASVLDMPSGYQENTKGARENRTKLRFVRPTVLHFAEDAGRSAALLGGLLGWGYSCSQRRPVPERHGSALVLGVLLDAVDYLRDLLVQGLVAG